MTRTVAEHIRPATIADVNCFSDGRPAMHYLPILQPRHGELLALEHVPEAAAPALLPVLEIQATGKGSISDAKEFFEDVRDRLPHGLRIAVDLSQLPEVQVGLRQTAWHLFEEMTAWGLTVLPVVWLHDGDRRLAQHARAASVGDIGAVLRLTHLLDLGAMETTTQALARIYHRRSLAPEQCDLLLDLAATPPDVDDHRLHGRLRAIIGWARQRPWRSITLASGAMPRDIRRCPRGRASRVPRSDAALWQDIADRQLNFGDYGVRSPVALTGDIIRGPLPNVRYTVDDAWWVYRWPYRDQERISGIYGLCHAIVASSHWPAKGPEFSWGDQEILRRALRQTGPGTSSDWIAWSTSHHIAHVQASLAAVGIEDVPPLRQRRGQSGTLRRMAK